MAILRKQVFILLMSILFCIGLYSDQSMIIIDKSGSMRGFSQTGELKKVYQSINDVLKKTERFANIQLYAFDENGLVQYNHFDKIEYYGDTLIDKASKDAFKRSPDLITILTDNIQDPGGQSPDSDVTKFYSLLKEDRVAWVFIFPLKLAFDGWTYHTPQWKGNRAAIIYAILLKNDKFSDKERRQRERAFIAIVSDLTKVLHSPQIRCKPLETGVQMNFKPVKKSDRNLNVTSKEVNITFPDFTSSPNFKIKLVLSSMYSNIAVSRGKLEGAAIGRIAQEGFFKDMKANDFNILVQPSEATIPPRAVDDRYKIVMSTQNLHYEKDLFSLLKMPFNKNGCVSGTLSVKIRIPKQNLQLSADTLEKYSTTSKEDPERIFGLNQLVPLLAESDEVVIEKSTRFNLFMPYPGWPGFLIIAILLIITAGLFVAMKFLKAPWNRYLLKINGQEQGEVRFLPLLWSPLHSPESGAICKARIKGDMMEVRPLPGYNWDGDTQEGVMIRSFGRGDPFSLSTDDGENLFIEMSPVSKIKNENDEEVYGEEDIGLFEE